LDRSGGLCSVSGSPGSDKSLTFQFDKTRYRLTVTKVGNGSGTITSSSPTGVINCGSECSQVFGWGSVIALTARPDPGSIFTGWGGACSGTGACSLTIRSDTIVNATFVPGNALTVAKTGAGSGTVTSDRLEINCGPTCSYLFPATADVRLTAHPSDGSVFGAWSGACSDRAAAQTGACIISMEAARTVSARFDLATYELRITKSGTGSGLITSPNGVNCGPVCSLQFSAGTNVTLTAIASNGSVFDGWSGACNGAAPQCSITMNAVNSVAATFSTVAPSYGLTVTKAGSGSGIVTSDRGEINCGATCYQTFSSGTNVLLRANASPGSTFAGWQGACSGVGLCSVNMSAARSVTAVFNATSTACVPSETTLCLSNNRFRVEVRWTDFEGHQGPGRVVNYTTTDSGIFWFFAAPTWELMVKVLNACQAPYNRFWVFAAGTTTVQYTLTVTDTLTGQVKQYTNPPGAASAATADTDTFATCP
jgi:hypothetical protein